MDLKKINEILSDLDRPSLGGLPLKVVHDKTPGNYWSEKYQGETSEKVVVYDLEDGSGLFLKVTRETDSYGDNERVTSVKFTKPTKKTVTVFE